MIQSNRNLYAILTWCLLPGFFSAPAQQESYTPQETPQTVREDFSENELQSFVKVNEKILKIQEESEQKMIHAIEAEGMSLDRFTEILESQRNPERETNASEAELVSFNKAAQFIINESQKTQTQLIATLEEEGIDVNTYHDILYAYQQSPNVQDKIHKIEQERN